MLYVGLDQHKFSSFLAVLDEGGKVKALERLPTDRSALTRFLFSLEEPCAVAFEAGRSWPLVYDWLCQLDGKVKVAEVHLAHPRLVRALAKKSKTDTKDALTLAHLLRVGLLPQAHIPSEESRQKRAWVRQRLFLVGLRTRLKNRIHARVDRHGLPTARFSDLFGKQGLSFLQQASQELPEPDGELLREDLDLLQVLQERIRELDRKVAGLARKDPKVRLLRSIPGLGWFFALLVRVELDEIGRFPSAKQLCSYCGLVPSVYASGEKTRTGRITKQGNPYLRWAFVEAVWPAIRKSPNLQAYFGQVCQRREKKAAKVAVARKLCELVWAVWRRGTPYEEWIVGPGSPSSPHSP